MRIFPEDITDQLSESSADQLVKASLVLHGQEAHFQDIMPLSVRNCQEGPSPHVMPHLEGEVAFFRSLKPQLGNKHSRTEEAFTAR